jgi:predicted nucleic acid-binding protein
VADTVCVDSCLAIKWVFNEALQDEAAELLSAWTNARIIVPASFFLECASAAYHKLSSGKITLAEAAAGLAFLERLGMEEAPPREVMLRTAELAHQLRIHAWDTVYLAVSEQYGCEFWTVDRELHRKASRLFEWIRLLS